MLSRRRYERVPFFCPLQLTALKGGAVIQGSALDISLGGVGLTSLAALPRGEPVAVRFLFTHEKNGIYEEVLGKVAYTKSDEDGNRIGIEFLEPLQEAAYPMLTRRLMQS